MRPTSWLDEDQEISQKPRSKPESATYVTSPVQSALAKPQYCKNPSFAHKKDTLATLGMPGVFERGIQPTCGVELAAYTTGELQLGPEKAKDHTPEVGDGMSPAVHATAVSEGLSDVGPYE